MHAAVILVTCAIVLSLAARLSDRLGWHHQWSKEGIHEKARTQYAHDVKVLFSVPIHDPWRDTLLHLLSQARYPRSIQFGVILECTSASDADFGNVDADIRSFVRVSHAPAPRDPTDAGKRIRRLVRRFVDGSETMVIFIHPRVQVMRHWDVIASSLLEAESRSTARPVILSAPAASHDGCAGFPTVWCRDSVVRRGTSRLATRPSSKRPRATPSVCWCSEFTAAKPDVLQSWPLKAAASPVAQTVGLHHVVPMVPLVEADPKLEEAILTADPGHPDASSCGAHERIGLTRDADDRERILKYGSSSAARLAVRFG